MPNSPDPSSHSAKDERQALAYWATRLLLGEPSPWPLGDGPSDMDSATAFFRAEGVGPLCNHALQTAGSGPLVPRTVRRHLRHQSAALEVLAPFRRQEDSFVLRCLREAGLRPLVLKGAAYSHSLYPRSYLRPSGDMDLLFADRESAQRAWQHLEHDGYKLAPNVTEGRYVSRQRTCTNPSAVGHALDIHWAISNTHTFVRALPFDELERDALPVPTLEEQARTLGPIHSLLFACLHLFGHERQEQMSKVLWLYDILLLGQQLSPSDWETFGHQAVRKGVAGICRHALDRVDECFPLAPIRAIRPSLVEAEAQEAFRPDRLRTPFLFNLYDLRALDGWSARIGWIRETLIPSPAYIKGRYAKRNNAWLPLLYAHRSAKGLAKRLHVSTKPIRRQ